MLLRKVFIIIFVLFIGCSPITHQPLAVSVEQVELIQAGMTVTEVQNLLGKPYKISHLYEGARDENIFIHQYPVRYKLYPFDKHNEALGPLSADQIEGKFNYRNSRFFNKGTFDRVYFLQFVFEDSLLVKYEPFIERK
jgi:hypothetical protein